MADKLPRTDRGMLGCIGAVVEKFEEILASKAQINAVNRQCEVELNLRQFDELTHSREWDGLTSSQRLRFLAGLKPSDPVCKNAQTLTRADAPTTCPNSAALGLNLGEGNSLRKSRSYSALGVTTCHYQQWYKDLEVIGAEYIVTEKKGKVVSTNGNLIRDLNISTDRYLPESEALAHAASALRIAAPYPWVTDSTGHPAPKGTRAIGSKGFAMTKESAQPVWRFTVGAYEVQINAVTGETVNVVSNIIPTPTRSGTQLRKTPSRSGPIPML